MHGQREVSSLAFPHYPWFLCFRTWKQVRVNKLGSLPQAIGTQRERWLYSEATPWTTQASAQWVSQWDLGGELPIPQEVTFKLDHARSTTIKNAWAKWVGCRVTYCKTEEHPQPGEQGTSFHEPVAAMPTYTSQWASVDQECLPPVPWE